MNSPAVITAIVGSLIAAGLATSVLKRRAYDVDQMLQLPGAHWLWGHEYEAWGTPDSKWYIRNTEENGLIFAMKGAFFHPDLLAVSDPGALHHIFTHSQRFVKSTVFRPLAERLFGLGLVWAEHAEHSRQRQIVAPLFTAARVNEMNDDVQGATETFIERFRHHITSNSTASQGQGLRVNILPWISRPTLDNIGKVGLGHDFGCGDSTEAFKIRGAFKVLNDMAMTFPGFVGPLLLRALPWISHLPFSAIQSQGVVKTVVKDIARTTVDDVKRAGDDDVQSRKDLLGKLIKTTDIENDVDVDMMLDQICTFVMVGHETTATAISLTLLELARHQDVQTALRKEVTEFGGSGPSGQLTYDDLSGSALPFVDAVCKEGLRMYPVSSHAERMASEDDVIPLCFPIVTKTGDCLNSIRVQKGQVFYIPSLAINRNTRIWGPDGHNFDPYRWLEPGRIPHSSSLTGGINGHFSFIEGPRLCVGYRFAIFEFKVILSALVKNFVFETTSDTIHTMWAMPLQPFIQGQRQAGAQLPLFVRPVDI